MTRMGHDSPWAALIYQHATSDADRGVAAALDALMSPEGAIPEAPPTDGAGRDDDEDGSAGALVRAG